jgi:5-methylcytosine-specific restriction enzyme A
VHRPAGLPAPVEQRRTYDHQRGTAHQRGYGARWQKARAGWLVAHPLCAACERQGRVTAATVVDHVIPHRGDMALFWAAATNWQSLCKPCHDAKTAREDGGFGNARTSGSDRAR